MKPTDSLADKTLAFWNLSSTFHGRPSKLGNITVKKLLDETNNIMSVLDPNRKVSQQTWRLQEDVIRGEPKSKKNRTHAKILRIKSAASI